MAIIYIHGVKVRSAAHGEALEKPFQRWLGARLAVAGRTPDYVPVFWGDAAAQFRWDLDSRPRTKLLRQATRGAFEDIGAVRQIASLPLAQAQPRAVSGPVLRRQAAADSEVPPLSAIPEAQRPDFIADLYLASRPRPSTAGDPFLDDPAVAALAEAAASVAQNWGQLTGGKTPEVGAAELAKAVHASLKDHRLIAQGGLHDWLTSVGEVLKRAVSAPADIVSTAFGELRPVANDFVANFLGDVLVYLEQRADETGAPGAIPLRVLAALKRGQKRKRENGERIIAITHSMGGQLLYDALTYFAPRDPELADLEIDHWISCGAQVSFFAELGLFKGQPSTAKPDKLPRPAPVKAWTNYYDPSDLVGFVMAPIFDGVTDEEYDTGYGLAFAHSGFLARPSFFEKVATRVGWGSP